MSFIYIYIYKFGKNDITKKAQKIPCGDHDHRVYHDYLCICYLCIDRNGDYLRDHDEPTEIENDDGIYLS